MTPDPILTLSAVCAALSLAGLYLVARLRAARHAESTRHLLKAVANTSESPC